MLIIAHRGASGTYLENTVSAFQAAYEMGARAIETDVRRCPCHKKLKLSHDPITSEVECVKLADFFEVLPYGERMDELHLEIKEKGLVREMLGITKHLRYHKNIIYSSFLWFELLKIKILRPRAKIGILWNLLEYALPRWEVVLIGKILGAKSIHFNLAALSSEMVTYFRQRGFLIYAYSGADCSPKSQISQALFLDLDGIFSDYPAYAKEILWEMTLQ